MTRAIFLLFFLITATTSASAEEISAIEIQIKNVTDANGKSVSKPFTLELKNGEVKKVLVKSDLPNYYLAAYLDGETVHFAQALGMPHWMVRRAKIFNTAIPLLLDKPDTPIVDLLIKGNSYSGKIKHIKSN